MLLNPVWHVALVKNCLVAAGLNYSLLRNWRFNVSIFVFEKAHPETVFVLLLDIGPSHADGAVARVVVGVNQVLDDINQAHCAAIRQVCPYPGFDGSVKSLYNGHILFALTGKVLDIVSLYHSLEVRVEELLAFVGL